MRGLIAALTALLLCACTGNTEVVENQTIPPNKAGLAQVVFMRSSQVNPLTTPTLYDVTSGKFKLLGDVPNGTRTVVDLAPGDYVFMVRSNGNAEFMKATVLPNKRYHVVVIPYQYIAFALRPVRQRNGEFLYSSGRVSELMNDTKLVRSVPSDSAEADRKKAEEIYQQAWPRWQGQGTDHMNQATLRKEDSAN